MKREEEKEEDIIEKGTLVASRGTDNVLFFNMGG